MVTPLGIVMVVKLWIPEARDIDVVGANAFSVPSLGKGLFTHIAAAHACVVMHAVEHVPQCIGSFERFAHVAPHATRPEPQSVAVMSAASVASGASDASVASSGTASMASLEDASAAST
jgi:hypothetical protein